jgi:predicted glycosyl hydrolase (DUF1957 family)
MERLFIFCYKNYVLYSQQFNVFLNNIFVQMQIKYLFVDFHSFFFRVSENRTRNALQRYKGPHFAHRFFRSFETGTNTWNLTTVQQDAEIRSFIYCILLYKISTPCSQL